MKKEISVETMTINGDEWVRKASLDAAENETLDGMKYVICRGYYCGVHAGYLKEHNGNHAVLINSRRLWYWKAKEGISLSAVAQHGIKADNDLPETLPEIWLGDVYEVIPCTKEAASTIINAPVKQQ